MQSKFVTTILATISLLAVMVCPRSEEAAAPQNVSGLQDLTIDSLQMPGLPVSIAGPLLTPTEKGYVLKGYVSNGSDDRIVGLRYLLLVFDLHHKVRLAAGRSELIKLPAYATRDFAFQIPIKQKIRSDDRISLVIEHATTLESSWDVLNAREVLEAYCNGQPYVLPEVRHVLNQFDSRPRPKSIY
jgi:hypothetical protein